ncbi:cytochrome c oxidase subunit 6C [Austrofundulus limnaeus]|uniref:Cytochrome c oxidase subunit 6C n=1 Tax=Austrofundulus limnaeus TaxID=52670 RepID=A0A2I4C3L3_AUSLI|nr:PREDICTED: cytochrome c oxidase subunit 6C-1 [Austrofundulus limnaeus]XP_013874582.1 PREDICTED: cytochrome c oxidase subunit 6C-1 [Austrofundulus limnaeus]
MSLPKPVMRGLLDKRMRFHVAVGAVLSIAAVIAFKYGVVERRKKAYADFYKNYDLEKEFNAMREAGVFESVRPSGE